jgi:hypothetical protein
MVATLTPSRITFDVSRLTPDVFPSVESAVDVSRFTSHTLFPGNTPDVDDDDFDLDTDPYLSAESASSAESAVPDPTHHKTRYYLNTYTPTAYPFPSAAGIKYRPTATDVHGLSCDSCPYLDDCRRAVFHGDGLALCEDLLDSELYPSAESVKSVESAVQIPVESAVQILVKEAIHA